MREANRQLGGHQQIRGRTVWPDEEFPRNSSMKVLKHEVLRWIQAKKAAEPPSSASATALAAAGAIARLVRQIEGVPADAVVDEARLSTDLGIDSLGRVELLSLVEEELGVYIDDGELDPDETVGGLQARVDASAAAGAAPPGGHLRLADEPAGERAAHRHPAAPPPAAGGAAVSAQGDAGSSTCAGSRDR